MNTKKIEEYITNELSLYEQEIALDFTQYLRKSEMEFIKGDGYWKDKIYYLVKFHDKCVCFIAIKDPDEKDNHWTVWSDDMGTQWLNDLPEEDELKAVAWKHVDFCGNCGSCGGGRHKVIFGKAFNNVCSCTFRVDNPNREHLPFLKGIVEIRKKEILEITE